MSPSPVPHASGALSLRHVSKQFPRPGGTPLQVLQDIHLEVQAGEFLAIVGASGCGKSTLLRLIVGLDDEHGGELLLDGRPIQGTSLERGMVFQEHRLLPWLTVEQNVALGVLNAPLSAAEKQRTVQDHLALVGLSAFAQAWPHQISGGMSQRVAIARALVSRPRVLLLDEPLGALDALTRSHLQQELAQLWARERVTMVLVTHDVDEAVALADRVVVLAPRPGRIREIVPVPLPRPRERGTAAFAAVREQVLSLIHEGERAEPADPSRSPLPEDALAAG